MNDAFGTPQSMLLLGATSEIGQAIVRSLVSSRCRRVVLACRTPATAEAFADELRSGRRPSHAVGPGSVGPGSAGVDTVETVAFDAEHVADHGRIIGEVFERGDIDVVVMAFAVLGDQARFDADPPAAAAAVATNLGGSVSAGIVVADRLRQQGHGALVVLSSVAGERVRAANFVYGATKAGLDGFAQGLGDALRGSGARVLTVRPGFVRTKMTTGMPEPPFTTGPDAVAAAVVRGLRSGAHTVWSPPALRYVFAVLRHLPRPLWRRLPG